MTRRTRRSRRRGPPRCNDCGRRIAWFRSPFTTNMRTFEPTPVRNPRNYVGPPAYPTEGRRAWQFREFVEELRMRHGGQTWAEAEEEAYAFNWHQLHHCPNDPTRDDEKGSDQ